MSQNPPAGKTDDADLHEEMRAVLHAGRELPSQLDDSVIDAFMERLDRHIDARIVHHDPVPATPFPKSTHKRSDAGNISAIIGVGIPFVVLAGVFGHTPGVILAVLVIGALAALQIVRETIG